jgi:hypothetical protein
MEDEITAWLRAQAEGDKAAALKLAAERGSRERGVRWTGTPEGLAAWEREWRERKAGSPLGRLALDLPEVIARAESVLAVLDEYGGADGFDLPEGVSEGRDYALGCVVRLLAYGYRHREGWRPEWA